MGIIWHACQSKGQANPNKLKVNNKYLKKIIIVIKSIICKTVAVSMNKFVGIPYKKKITLK